MGGRHVGYWVSGGTGFICKSGRPATCGYGGRKIVCAGWLVWAWECGLFAGFSVFPMWPPVFKSPVFWLVFMMALMTVASQFGIQPLMAQLKADALPREVMESVFRDRFATWHGVSSILYLIQSLLGLWLVVWSGRGLR